jgi:hypothetical protein
MRVFEWQTLMRKEIDLSHDKTWDRRRHFVTVMHHGPVLVF